jgi:phenylpyruvate tautomerase PptA (4-oxalocrotonate tautomerase family)
MPFINAKVTCKISASAEKAIKDELGQAIRILPGKSEQWLMVGFEPEYHLYFQGTKEPDCAFIDVKVYGEASPSDYDHLTKRITAIFSTTLSIPANRIYVAYEETPYWGFDGADF